MPHCPRRARDDRTVLGVRRAGRRQFERDAAAAGSRQHGTTGHAGPAVGADGNPGRQHAGRDHDASWPRIRRNWRPTTRTRRRSRRGSSLRSSGNDATTGAGVRDARPQPDRVRLGTRRATSSTRRSRAPTAWGAPTCAEPTGNTVQCSWLQTDAAPSLLLVMEGADWRVSHPVFNRAGEPASVGTGCIVGSSNVNFRGGPSTSWPRFAQINPGTCSVTVFDADRGRSGRGRRLALRRVRRPARVDRRPRHPDVLHGRFELAQPRRGNMLRAVGVRRRTAAIVVAAGLTLSRHHHGRAADDDVPKRQPVAGVGRARLV